MNYRMLYAPGRMPWWAEPVPMEMLPIPYTLTDFGRAQLAEWRAMESEWARGFWTRPGNGSQLPPQEPRRKRSRRKR